MPKIRGSIFINYDVAYHHVVHILPYTQLLFNSIYFVRYMNLYLLRHIKCYRTSKRKAGSGLYGSKSMFFLLFHLNIRCIVDIQVHAPPIQTHHIYKTSPQGLRTLPQELVSLDSSHSWYITFVSLGKLINLYVAHFLPL